MRIEVNEEGVHTLHTIAGQITEVFEEMLALTEETRAMADEHENKLGPHEASLQAALEDVHMSIKRASNPAEDIAKRLTEIATAYQELI